MASLSGTVTDVVSAVQGVVGLSRPSRLRRQLQHTIELYESVKPHEELAGVAANLAAVIEIHGERLLGVSQPRKRDWSSFIVGLLLTAGIGVVGLELRDTTTHWWGWVLLAPIAVVVLAGLSVSFGYIRGVPADRTIHTTVDALFPALVARGEASTSE